MILFFDTETTGLPDNRMPLGDSCQPHLVQLACLLTDDDGAERSHANLIVNPGVPIPNRASDVHGITDEIAERAGVSSLAAVAIWNRLAERADLIVAHNIKFDLAIIETAWIRTKTSIDFEQKHGSRRRFCTMEASTPIVNLPPTERMIAAGFDKPKSPKLEEAIKHFFGESLDGAHDAMVDMRACARLYFHLQSMKAAA
ncbi:3'-5' exonuclease [Acidiphilium sp.]|uniref:3'-5' exonuclease n=1 Tax=Acidiphilium sp. TaxID=527 RepID=UPI002B9C8FD2|nr:3'-5' exonuclease [Acidiphilium sp.]HQT62792.1 3'-5' exonuclease [Acidiphilium sp.]